ncbi:hypothetical protein Btru_022267 [Bulinus truncatus]|nr:hypothetical protein Btru_022267 [Bulinus truncatus]
MRQARLLPHGGHEKCAPKNSKGGVAIVFRSATRWTRLRMNDKAYSQCIRYLIYLFSECKLGYYGRKCENQCGQCVGGPIFCDPSDGFCVNGCARGYRGKICSETRVSRRHSLDVTSNDSGESRRKAFAARYFVLNRDGNKRKQMDVLTGSPTSSTTLQITNLDARFGEQDQNITFNQANLDARFGEQDQNITFNQANLDARFGEQDQNITFNQANLDARFGEQDQNITFDQTNMTNAHLERLVPRAERSAPPIAWIQSVTSCMATVHTEAVSLVTMAKTVHKISSKQADFLFQDSFISVLAVCPTNHYGEKCALVCICVTGCGCHPVTGTCYLPEKCRTMDQKHSSPVEEEGRSRWHVSEPREKRDENGQKPPGETSPDQGAAANTSSPIDQSQTNKIDTVAPGPKPPGSPSAGPDNGAPGSKPPGSESSGADKAGPESKPPSGESTGQKEQPKREPFSNTPRDPEDRSEKGGSSSGTQMMCSKLEQEFCSLKEKLNNKVDIPLWPLAILLIITSVVLISVGLWDMWHEYKREVYMAEWEKENLDKPLEEAALMAQGFE